MFYQIPGNKRLKMKKYSSLVKKVNLFEKLAAKGSRKDFLKSLAQDLSRAKELVSQVKTIMTNHNITDENILNGLGNVSLFGKTDPAALRGAANSARALMHALPPLAPNSVNDQKTLMGIIAALNDMAGSQEPGTSEMPMDNSKQNQYPTIDPKIQKALNKVLVTTGRSTPIEVDGILGPETRNAINKIKTLILKNDKASDQEAFDKVLRQANMWSNYLNAEV